MKYHYLLIDTETTQTDLVADFGAIVVDRKGNILAQCAVLVGGIFTDSVNHPLFFDPSAKPDDFFAKASLARRYENYQRMLDSGTRMIASVNAINRWLARASASFNPILTAYNLPFDLNKCANTGIDLSLFERNFCLWRASFTQWAHTKAYRQMILDCHAFNAPTQFGNMSFKTNAEMMARFVTDNAELEDEPHTALEDLVFYELPILTKLLKRRSAKWCLTETNGFDWRKVQVRDWFKPS